MAGRVSPQGGPQATCELDGRCITCGDVADPMRVVHVDLRTSLARCEDEAGSLHEVMVDLVAPLDPGDTVLVHAGVALVRLEVQAA